MTHALSFSSLRQPTKVPEKNPSLAESSLAKLFPSLNAQEIAHQQEELMLCVSKIPSLATSLGVCACKIEKAVANIFSHYRYHKLNCWTIYRSVFATSQKALKAPIATPKMKKKLFFQLTLQRKLQELHQLLSIQDPTLFSSYLENSMQGNKLALSCPAPQGTLHIESFYKKEAQVETFSYSYHFQDLSSGRD